MINDIIDDTKQVQIMYVFFKYIISEMYYLVFKEVPKYKHTRTNRKQDKTTHNTTTQKINKAINSINTIRKQSMIAFLKMCNLS